MRTACLLILLLLAPVALSTTRIVAAELTPTITQHTFTLDTLTVYNPVTGQTDSDPLITASNAAIDTINLRTGVIRWMALSRDLLQRWGGKINYGDTVHVTTGDPGIDGLWVIQDTMNKRYRKRGDLLFDAGIRKLGRWTNVKLKLINA